MVPGWGGCAYAWDGAATSGGSSAGDEPPSVSLPLDWPAPATARERWCQHAHAHPASLQHAHPLPLPGPEAGLEDAVHLPLPALTDSDSQGEEPPELDPLPSFLSPAWGSVSGGHPEPCRPLSGPKRHCLTHPCSPARRLHRASAPCTSRPAPAEAAHAQQARSAGAAPPGTGPGVVVVQAPQELAGLHRELLEGGREFGYALHMAQPRTRQRAVAGAAAAGVAGQPWQGVVECVAISPRDGACFVISGAGQQLLGPLQALLTDERLTKVGCEIKEQLAALQPQPAAPEAHPLTPHQPSPPHQSLLAGLLVDVWVAQWLTAPDYIANLRAGGGCAGVAPSKALEHELQRITGQHAEAHAHARGPLGPSPGPALPALRGLSRGSLSAGVWEAVRVAALARALWGALKPVLLREGLLRALVNIEMPLAPVLAAMQGAGVACDPAVLLRHCGPLERRILQLKRLAHEAAAPAWPYTVNLASPQQLAEALPKLRPRLMPPAWAPKLKAGGLSSRKDVLKAMRDQHPVVPLLLEHRRLTKLRSTYVAGALGTLCEQCPGAARAIAALQARPAGAAGAAGGVVVRVRAHVEQAATATGRLSVSKPSLQTFPATPKVYQTGPGPQDQATLNCRAAFIAPPGCVLLSVDMCQIELRLMGHFCRDPSLCRLLASGHDPFLGLAAMFLRMSADQVTQEQRALCKQVTYALMYGLGSQALANKLSTDVRSAERLSRQFLESVPSLGPWMSGVLAECRAHGFVTTLAGRRRYLPDIRSANDEARAAAERRAVNTVMQGSAADVIKRAMAALHSQLAAPAWAGAARLVLQVHDELLYEVAECRLADVARLVAGTMSGAWQLRVPLRVKCSAGRSWGELQEVQVAWE